VGHLKNNLFEMKIRLGETSLARVVVEKNISSAMVEGDRN